MQAMVDAHHAIPRIGQPSEVGVHKTQHHETGPRLAGPVVLVSSRGIRERADQVTSSGRASTSVQRASGTGVVRRVRVVSTWPAVRMPLTTVATAG